MTADSDSLYSCCFLCSRMTGSLNLIVDITGLGQVVSLKSSDQIGSSSVLCVSCLMLNLNGCTKVH
jgi:hypothetical protein